MVVSSAPAFSQDVNSAFAAAGKQSGIAYVHVKDVPSDVWSAISQKAKLAPSDFAEPGGKWEATDNIRDPKLPQRRLIFAQCSAETCILYYEHGGIGRHEHALLIKRGRKPELIANAYTNERANSLNQLRSACEKHELAPATDF